MLQIKVPLTVEAWDSKKEEFIEPKYQVLQLEHSLVSLSKWESKWCKPFLSHQEKSDEETLDYIKCMTLTQNVRPEVYNLLTIDNIKQINSYIEAPMTATHFYDREARKAGKEIITAELIYYWMITLNIPFECQKWHINRLLTLIKVCSIKSQPPRKRSKREIISQYADLNEQRKKQLNTKG